MAGGTEAPLPSLDLRIAQDMVMAPCLAQEHRPTAGAHGGFMEGSGFARDLRALVVPDAASVEAADEPP